MPLVTQLSKHDAQNCKAEAAFHFVDQNGRDNVIRMYGSAGWDVYTIGEGVCFVHGKGVEEFITWIESID